MKRGYVRPIGLDVRIVPARVGMNWQTIAKAYFKQSDPCVETESAFQYGHSCQLCPACGRVDRKGPHYERMEKLIEQIAGK